MKKNRLVISCISAVIVLAGIQLIPVDRTNPPVETEIAAPAHVQAILRQACYDCHSNLTVWPWYSRVAPVSWLIASDVTEGRTKLNFTTWNRYSTEVQNLRRTEVWEEVKDNDMPPLPYRLMHRQARLSEEERKSLQAWSTGTTP